MKISGLLIRYFFPFVFSCISLEGQQNLIPDIPDSKEIRMTFLEQERTIVLQQLKNVQFQGDETILHLGCRNGYLSNEIAQYLPQGTLIGIENIPVEESQPALPNVKFTSGRLKDQNWESLFDYIISTHSEEMDDNPEEFITAIMKALKPGGAAIIVYSLGPSGINPLTQWLKSPEIREYAEYFRFWDNNHCTQHLFPWDPKFDKGSDIELRKMIAHFKDLDIFRREARQWFKGLSFLPSHSQEIYLHQLAELMHKSGFNVYKNGEIEFFSFAYSLKIAFCRKKP